MTFLNPIHCRCDTNKPTLNASSLYYFVFKRLIIHVYSLSKTTFSTLFMQISGMSILVESFNWRCYAYSYRRWLYFVKRIEAFGFFTRSHHYLSWLFITVLVSSGMFLALSFRYRWQV